MITTRKLYDISFRTGVQVQLKEQSGESVNGQTEWNKLEEKTGELKNQVLLDDGVILRYNSSLKPIYEMMKVYIEKFKMDGANEFNPKSNHFFCQLMNLVDKKSNFEIKLNKIMQIGFNAGQLYVFLERNTLPFDRNNEIKQFIETNNMLDLDTYVSHDTQHIIDEIYLRDFQLSGGYGRKIRRTSARMNQLKRNRSRNRINHRGGMPIKVPDWAKIVDYRTMNDDRKKCAVDGCGCCQTEWMVEEVNEFYEAVHIGDTDEIDDEAVGLIRTYQQFRSSPNVVALWEKVRNDVREVFSTRVSFERAFEKWHIKKLKKKQALDVTAQQLIDIADLRW